MVTNGSKASKYKGALGRSGTFDWIVQRRSAVIMIVYFSIIAWFFCSNSPVEYGSWVDLFNNLYFKAFTVVFLISLIQHAWIGVWIIATDYISVVSYRIVFLGIGKLLAIGYLVWGIYILFF